MRSERGRVMFGDGEFVPTRATKALAGYEGPRPLLAPRVFVAMLALLVALGLVLGVSLGSSLTVAFCFLPAFVAGVGTVRQTAAAAGAGFLVVLVALWDDDRIGEPTPALVVAGIGALCVIVCHLRIHRTEEVTRLRSLVAALQRQLLQPLPVTTGQLSADGLYQPVEVDSLMGGDLYDLETSPYGTRVLIADVQGKGLQTVGTTMALLAAFREAAHHVAELPRVADALEDAVHRHNARSAARGEPERFVTALLLSFDDEGRVSVVDCGHVSPQLVRHTAREVLPIEFPDPGLPLGMGELAPGPRTLKEFTLPRDATLFVCTDGVTESRSADGDFYPLEDRLRAWAADPPEQLTEALRNDLHTFIDGSPRDDIAWLTLRRP
ncbi:serine/threonine-protein phosphatase [Streptomyces sp. XM4193]|uniref:PP2C family protein-serine/threonine phosphatase n=1 Tax=Streptomyces sp. XM4193 TaxID=2929782 RepID=UPI001FF7F679|nr:PP2C family protein-serine/threonine phosphatase [Streptomyces sp. XM4193]MCK1797202.1 serine/threonine-protein phosphatase [Streptomyces sp. XM4193]